MNKFASPMRVRPTIRVSSHNRLLYPASLFFLFLSMGAFNFVDRLIYGEGWYGKTGDKFTQSINLLGIAISLLLFWLSRQQPTRAGRALPLAIAAFLLTSALWSADPLLAITQGTLYFFTVLGFIALVELWDVDALIGLIAKVIAVCAVLSLFFPKYESGFAGIFPQKNVLGQVMAAGVFTALHGWRTRRSLIYPIIIALCITVAVLSQSTTSLLVIAIFVGMDILGRLYLRGGGQRALGVVGAVVAAAVVIVFLVNEAMLLEMLGKDPTLTGRTEIWPYVIANFYERPLFGWGYFGFWTPANPAALSIAQTIALEHDTWFVAILPNAHNTLLEALLEIGIVGTTFFIVLMVRYVIAAMRCFKGPAKHLGLSSLMLMSGLVIVGFSEVVLLSAQLIFTGLFFMVGMACERKMWQYRHARYHHAGSELNPRHIRPNLLVRSNKNWRGKLTM